MSEQNYSIDRDLKEAEAMAKALAPYVRVETLYGSVGGGFFNKMPSLTIGSLLLRLRRLNVLKDEMTSAQRSQLLEIESMNRSVYNEWRMHYETKMVREANSRLDAMKHYFDECNSNPKLCASVYRPEAFRRTVVEEIIIEMEHLRVESAELHTKKRATDSKLRGYVRPANFLWDARLQLAYEERVFWWLYQHPPQVEK